MIAARVEQCRLCGHQDLVPVCDLGVMSFTGIFPGTVTERVPEGPLELVACHGGCGLVQLRHTFDPQVLFGAGYGYRSGLNRDMAAHLHDIAVKIKGLVRLAPGDAVVDVGSSDGTLLRSFSGQGLCLLGVDPAAGHFSRYYPSDVRIIADLFSPGPVRKELNGQKAKVLTAIAVFYDMADPLGFLRHARDMLADDGVIVLEQGYWPGMLKGDIYDMICHEHVAYYGARQVKWLAEKAGLKVVHGELNGINGGSLCVVLAKQDAVFACAEDVFGQLVREEEGALSDSLGRYRVFREHIKGHRDALRQKIRSLRARGLSVAGYGASTKGNVLLQFCGFTPDDIAFIAEINEDKWGRVCPGTRIPIIAEEEARGRRPDVFLVLPWHLKQGLLARERPYLLQGGVLLFPWPGIHAVDRP